MRKIALFFFLLFYFIQVTRAQDNLPPVFELKTDTVLSAILPDEYWQMLEDEDGKYNFNQVSTSPLKERFHYDSPKQVDFHIPTYWFRFSIKNVTNHPLNISFYENYKAISDWYITDANGKVSHKTGGLTTPWSKNDNLKFISYFEHSAYLMPLVVDSGKTLVILNRVYFDYFNLNFTFPRKLNISFGSTERVILQNTVVDQSHYFNSVHDAFFFGIMLLAAIFNLFSYLIIREKTYFFFSLYVFFLGFGRFNIDSEFYIFFLREHPGFYIYFKNFIWTFSDFFLAFFLRSLLNTKKYYPHWDKFIFWLTVFNSALFLLHPFIDYLLRGTSSWGIGTLGSFISSSILFLFLSITLFLFLRRNVFLERRFLLAIIPSFVIWTIGMILFNIVLLHQIRFDGWVADFVLLVSREWHIIETVCLLWQVLCFSWLLFHRFVELKQQVVRNELEKEVERNQLIDGQRIELEKQVNQRTFELKQSLENLKSTQSQLIQSEKMASLGELTAGIAHEIQNPLNFVNNFSEVNTELIDELQSELNSGNAKEALAISGNIRDNEQRISHHGRRADAIVKGMLQHSQVSSGKMEPADLNGIADEYLRLAYHGLRAKDKEFNLLLKTDYDGSVGEININSQDIGRVLLNLYNNAFYSVNERKKTELPGYEPTVSVTTRKLEGKVEISVEDNGSGIPEKIQDKIFQPFFTTKPTGLGTGLGLSISYDIIKGHGGELKLRSLDGQGASFIIQIPC